jgi:hypothetical protein
MANEVGSRSVAFEVHDLDPAVDQLTSAGYGLVGGIGEYEISRRMAYVRGPEGIIVAPAQPIREQPSALAMALGAAALLSLVAGVAASA